MSLSKNDLKLLKRIVECGHELERLWPEEQGSPSDLALSTLDLLVDAISLTASAESNDLRRLAFRVRDLTPSMTARHLGGILVPFERLLGRTLRDDEILVSEKDKSKDGPSERNLISVLESDFGKATEPLNESLTVIADNIRSAFNVGAILRTAECFGIKEVVLTGYTPTPMDEKTARTSMGADSLVPWQAAADAGQVIDGLRAEGYTIVALETVEEAEELGAFDWPQRTALLLGNERFGLDRELLLKADRFLRIPLVGRKNSLNVGIAFGIAAADWRKSLVSTLRTVGNPSRNLIEPASQATYQDLPLSPIGIFKTSAVYPYEASRQAANDGTGEVGCIELERGRQFEQAILSLEGFSRIWLLYRFHHNSHWKPMVRPPRGPPEKRGVFATRSPYRPNPIGLSCVELIKVDGLRLYVRGFDLLDGTPIYDIKPYLPYADSFQDCRTGWIENLTELSFRVNFSMRAEQQVHYLEEQGVSRLREFLHSQLEYDPLDGERKRVHVLAPESNLDSTILAQIAYRTWRADFKVDHSSRSIEIIDIKSGYNNSELNAPQADDRYRDKDLHRAFISRSWHVQD
jgi:tRNA-Thr(GGU) m(6)t(6)A37 methyltransferase TsaA